MGPHSSRSSVLALFTLTCWALAASAQETTPPAAPQPPSPPAPGAPPPEAPGAPGAAEPAPASQAAPSSEEAKKAYGEEVVVTGTRVRRKDLTTPAPVTVIGRDQIEASGKVSIGEFLQLLPEQGNAPNFQLNNGGATYGADGATRVNLRSLGVNRTLVLVNGRRFVASGLGADASVDLNTIPAAAVERVEILKDGASAVYGSDAIAGVVNVITRTRYDTTEASAQYGISGHGDAQTFDGHLTTGRSGQAGNFLFSLGFFDQKDSWLRDRSWSSHALTYDYTTKSTISGGSYRTPQGSIGLPSDANGNELPACAANALCHGLVTSDPTWTNDAFIRDPSSPLGWRLMTNADTYNYAADNYLTLPARRVQLYSAGDTRFEPARVFYEVSYVQNGTQENAAPMPLNPGDYTLPGTSTPISVSANSMYNPFGVDLPFAGRRLVEFGNRTYRQDLATFRVVTGVDGTLPGDVGLLSGWYWEGFLNYGQTNGTFTTNGAIRNSRIADAVGPSMMVGGVPRCVSTPNDPTTVIPGCVPLNLFGGPNNGSIDPSQIGYLGFEGTSRAYDGLFAVGVNLTGDLVKLTADRPMSLAVGYEFRREAGSQIADPIAASGDSADFNFTSTSGSFQVNEVYGELSIPLLTDAPGAKDLEASVAGRYVNYNTFGGNFSYKLGARYTPIPDATLRGTFSTAFRAPAINELYLGQQETAPIASDPCNFNPATAPPALVAQCAATGVGGGGSGDQSNQVLARTGGNPDLKPETARIYTVGVVLEPRAVANLSVTVDYYDIRVDDIIGYLGVPTILAACYPAASGSSAAPAYCDLVHRATTGRILYVSDVKQNVGQLRTSGIDLSARYGWPTSIGRLGFSFDGSWLGRFDSSQTIAGATQTIHGRGNYDLSGRGFGGALPDYKFNVGASWALAGFSVGALGRVVGSFKECGAFDTTTGHYISTGGLCYADPAAPSRQVGTNATLDLNGAWTRKSSAGRTTVQVGLSNVFDKAPQYVYSAALANSDPTVYDYLGRYFYMRVQQAF